MGLMGRLYTLVHGIHGVWQTYFQLQAGDKWEERYCGLSGGVSDTLSV